MKVRNLLSLVALLAGLTLSSTLRAENTNTQQGKDALKNDHGPNSGQNNSAFGYDTLYRNTTGSNNSGFGVNALYSNTTGSYNAAFGSYALFNSTTDSNNSAFGAFALWLSTSGSNNTAIGQGALSSNSGSDNVAVGLSALVFNGSGNSNIAVGDYALSGNGPGSNNTALGGASMLNNYDGADNVAVGLAALASNNGSRNSVLGAGTLSASVTGNGNTALGYGAGSQVTGNNNIDIGSVGAQNDSNTIRIGQQTAVMVQSPDPAQLPAHTATFIAGIFGSTSSTGIPVYVNANGQLGTMTSSARFKDDIKPMKENSSALLQLKPVTFRYKTDKAHTPQFGLVAEDVAKVNPSLVARDGNGEIYTVRYEAVNAMLLNEFLKEHQKVEDQQKQIDRLESQLQKISAKLDGADSPPQ